MCLQHKRISLEVTQALKYGFLKLLQQGGGTSTCSIICSVQSGLKKRYLFSQKRMIACIMNSLICIVCICEHNIIASNFYNFVSYVSFSSSPKTLRH